MFKNSKIILFFILIIGTFTSFAQELQYQNNEMEYDDLNRLTKVVFSNGIVHEYIYDNVGNRLERLVYEAPKTYVPDDAFEQHLIDLGFDTVMDDYVFTHRIDDIEALFMTGIGIADLTGVEDFEALNILYCSANSLTQINVSENLNLQELYCSHNELLSINVANNSDLINLQCYNNPITILDVSSNLLLDSLGCGNSLIQTLDVSQNTNLIWFEAINGQLEFLNIANGNNNDIAYMNTGNNPSLFCIQVDDENAANNNAGVYADWQTDDQVQYSYNCVLTYVPDDAFEQRLIDLGYDVVLNDYVVTANIENIELIFLDNLGISDLTGIEDFDSLGSLFIEYNQLTQIDLSQNINLLRLICENNMLTSLDISNNINLLEINFSENQITNIDVSQNVLLQVLDASLNYLTHLDLSANSSLNALYVGSNYLESLNAKNGNNSILTDLNANNHPNLLCIQVDDENAANNGTGVYGSWLVDAQVGYSEDCGVLGIPENSLEGISLYPNPTENILYLFLPKYVGMETKYLIYDTNGKLLKRKVTLVENPNLKIDVSKMSSGMYLIEVIIEGKKWSSKFIKK